MRHQGTPGAILDARHSPGSGWVTDASFRLRLFGPFELTRHGAPVRLPTRKIECLLAYLVLRPERHSREKLAALLWGEVPDEQARVSLRYALAMLRKQIGGELLDADRETVQLNPSFPLWVDAAAISGSGLRRFDPGSISIEELKSKIEDYRGDLLADFYDDWILPEREHYRQLFLDGLLYLTQHYRSTSEYAPAIETARRVLRSDPANERAHQHLMFCYVALGNRQAALLQYERCVVALNEELAATPSSETTALYEWIKEARGESAALATRITNLPIPLTSFIGREREMREIKELLAPGAERTRPLVTLTGAGGSGKTRLAIQVATDLIDAYRDGVWWVELAALIESAAVPQAVAKALGVRELAQQPLIETLEHFLRDRQALLVIDNCEHLLEACAQVGGSLLQACGQLQILATSRESLRVDGEKIYLVPTLSIPGAEQDSRRQPLLGYESVRLFVERARAVHNDFVMDAANEPGIAQICQRLDGIPLALELAAARSNALSVSEIAARLHDRFRLLTHGSRTALPRQQTLRATIDWSHDLLSERERVLFRRLAVFTGGFTLDAATVICGGRGIAEPDVEPLVLNLFDKSLLSVTRSGATRYFMLETIREYAIEKLAGSDEFGEFSNRHSDFFLGFVERADPRIKSGERLVWTERYMLEHENIQAALKWAIEHDTAISTGLPSALFRFWLFRGYFAVGRQWMELLLASPQAARPELRARALITAGEMAAWVNDPKGIEMLESSLALCRELGDKKGTALALQWLGLNYAYSGEFARARTLSAESVQIFRELGDVWQLGEALCWQGRAALFARDFAASRELFVEGKQLLEQTGDKWDTGFPLHDLAKIAYLEGDYAAARNLAKSSLDLMQEAGDKGGVSHVANTLGQILRAQGDYLQAGEYYRDSLHLMSAEQEELIGQLHSRLGFVELHIGTRKRARREFETSLAIAHQIGDATLLTCNLIGFGALAALKPDAGDAVQLLAAANALIEGKRVELEPPDRDEYRSLAATLRAQLETEAFDAAWQAGGNMTIEQAIAAIEQSMAASNNR